MTDGTVRIKVETNADSVSKQFRRLDDTVNDTTREFDRLDDEAKQVKSTFGGLKTAAGALIGAFAVSEIVSFNKGLVNTALQLEGLEFALKASVKGFVDYSDALGEVNRIIDSLGLDLVSTSEGFAKFSASALRSNLSFEQTVQIFEDISKASVSLRLDTERTKLVFDALAQIAGKGVVSMEELRQQLGDSLPGAVAIGAKAVGKTTQEFIKMIEKGEVISQDFLPKFAKAMREELGGSAEEASRGARAAITRLNNDFVKLRTELGEELLPAVFDITKEMTDLAGDENIKTGLKSLVELFGDIATAVVKSAGLVAEMYTNVKQLLDGVGILDAVADGARGIADGFDSVIKSTAELITGKNLEELKKQTADIRFEARKAAGEFDKLSDGGKIDQATEKVDGLALSCKKVADNLSSADELLGAISGNAEKAAGSIDGSIGKSTGNIQKEVANVADNAIDDLADALTTPFEEGETAAQRFGDIALNVLQQITQALIKQAALSAIGAAFGGPSLNSSGGVGTSPQGPAFAKGGAFSGGVQKFANGGAFTNSIVSSPTTFPMSGGKTGLMGEAGAEAIMPLKRDAQGRLGVTAQAQQSTVNVYNNTDSQIEVVQRPDNEQDIFINRVRNAVADERMTSTIGSQVQRTQRAGIQGA